MYTKNSSQLVESFNYVLEKNNLTFSRGLKIDHISTEDCVPCFEVYSNVKITKKRGKEILQEMANELDIQVIFGYVERDSTGFSELRGYLDIEPDIFIKNSGEYVPALTENPDFSEIEEDFGKIIKPKRNDK